MKRIIYLIALACFLPLSSINAQDTPINQLDKDGLKTGPWKKYYGNGKLMYEGSFTKGKPVGKMIRYHEGGIKKAEMIFLPESNISYAKLYYENGDLAAEGKYVGKVKDSTWNYYSFYNQRLTVKENYLLGEKDGLSIIYYDKGEIAEKMEWKKNVMHGSWEQFFENGIARLRCYNNEGERDGRFESFHSDGTRSITGNYINGKMDGKWIYYAENNEIDIILEYQNGIMLPNPEYEKRQKEFSKLLDESVKSMNEPNPVEFR